MTINGDVKIGVERVPSRQLSALVRNAKEGAKEATRASPATPDRRDGVVVSAEGRALGRGAALTPERIAEVRHRILSGAYGDAAVVDAVARRIQQSGDL
jgi:hypothetical protein